MQANHFRQGHLDRLCGLYAIVNAMPSEYPDFPCFEREHHHALFERMIDTLAERGDLAWTLSEGLMIPQLSKLLDTAVGFLEERGIECEVARPFIRRNCPTMNVFHGVIRQHLRKTNTSVIVMIRKPHKHWTVIETVADSRFCLRDSESWGSAHIEIKEAELSRSRYASSDGMEIIPASLFLLTFSLSNHRR